MEKKEEDVITNGEGRQVQTLTVYDPVNRQAYKLKKSDFEYTVGLRQLRAHQGSSKRVFLCKNYQVNECKAQKHCNSVHAKRDVIAELRAQFPITEEDLESEITLHAKDPITGIEFTVRKNRTAYTKGVELAQDRAVLLCLNYDKKGCPAGEGCPFLHIDSSYMQHVRILWRVPCCVSCAGSRASFPLLKGDRQWESFIVSSVTPILPRSSLAITKGLRDLCRKGRCLDNVLFIPLARVCRPHQRISCKWGHDCSGIHICRHKYAQYCQQQQKPEEHNLPSHQTASMVYPATPVTMVQPVVIKQVPSAIPTARPAAEAVPYITTNVPVAKPVQHAIPVAACVPVATNVVGK